MKRGNAQAVMPSYNEIDGVPSHANRWLLQRRAARRDGLQGRGGQRLLRHPGARMDYITSTPDPMMRGVRALNAGVDVDMPDGEAYAHAAAGAREGARHAGARSTRPCAACCA